MIAGRCWGQAAFAAVSLLTLQVRAAPAVDAPAEGTATAWEVTVADIDADGRARPLPDVEVVIEALRSGEDGAVEVAGRQTVRSDARGRVQVPSTAAPGEVQLRFDGEHGPTVVTPGARRWRLGRFVRSLQPSDLTSEVRANLEVGEGNVRLWMAVTLQTKVPGVMRWTEQAPLALPVLAPRAGDVVLDRGVWPRGAAVRVAVLGDGDVTMRDGTLWLRGSVALDRPLEVRVAYTLPIKAATMALGLRGVVAATQLTVAVAAQPSAAPRLSAQQPAQVGVHRDGRQHLVGLALRQPLRTGEVATLTLSDLPVRAAWPGRLLAGAVALTCIGGLGWVLRRPRPADEGPAA